MKKLIVLVGISGAGKSTFAHKEWLKSPLNIVIISRDGVRNLLWNYTEENVYKYYNLENFNILEQEVSEYCDFLIIKSLEIGKTVILDNTNLNKKRDIESLNRFGVPVEIKFFDITLKEALTRNMSRLRKVDEKIIEKQYTQYINLRRD